jgi:uncharacterized membrane protein YdbT with pleckstrin-like domain
VLFIFYIFTRAYDTKNIIFYFLLAFLLVRLIIFFSHLIAFKSLHFTLTNQRIVRKEGFFNQKTRDVELFRIKDVIMNEPLLMKLFNCGNIVLVSTQIDSALCNFFAVKNAKDVRELIRKTVFERRTEMGVTVRENE